MESSSNYEKCLTSKLVRYDWSRCRTSRWKSSRETLTMKRSLLHIREVHFIHQWIVVIRLISCCLFLHFHAWSTVYHLQSRVSFIALKSLFLPRSLLLSTRRLASPRYTKKGQKSKKIIGLIILYACRECFSTHARRWCEREGGEVEELSGNRAEQLYYDYFFLLTTPTICENWEELRWVICFRWIWTRRWIFLHVSARDPQASIRYLIKATFI